MPNGEDTRNHPKRKVGRAELDASMSQIDTLMDRLEAGLRAQGKIMEQEDNEEQYMED
jgi:hypothetical protein